MSSGSSPNQSGFTILSILEEPDLEWIFQKARERQVTAGTDIVDEGVPGETVYIILDGLVAVSSAALGEREIARLGPGQIFGEMSFLEDRPTSARVTAVEDARVLAIPRRELESKLAADAGMAARIYKAFAIIATHRLRQLAGTIARWIEIGDVSPVSPAVMKRWQEIAEQTQQFKSLMLLADKDDADAPSGAALVAGLRKFSEFITRAIGEDSPETAEGRDELGTRIQREILPYLLKARTIERLYQKPRGFSCDYEVLQMLVDHAPAGVGQLGPSLDRAFLGLPAIRALRKRPEAIAAEIVRYAAEVSGPIGVTGFGSGAADSLVKAGKAVGNGRVEGTIVDFDSQALAAAKVASENSQTKLRLVGTSIVPLAGGRWEFDLPEQHLIYAQNLADLLDDRLLLRFLNRAHRKLRAGGELVLSSFHLQNPDRALMEHVIDWKIRHRSEEELTSLFRQSSFQSAVPEFRSDEKSIILLALCRKPA